MHRMCAEGAHAAVSLLLFDSVICCRVMWSDAVQSTDCRHDRRRLRRSADGVDTLLPDEVNMQ